MTKRYVTGNDIKKAAEYLTFAPERGGCYHWPIYLGTVDNKNIFIVLGWTQSPNDDNPDRYYDKGYRLAIKVGYQPTNSIMQSDYDVDFKLPYDLHSGYVMTSYEYLIHESTDFGSLAEEICHDASVVLKGWKGLGHD